MFPASGSKSSINAEINMKSLRNYIVSGPFSSACAWNWGSKYLSNTGVVRLAASQSGGPSFWSFRWGTECLWLGTWLGVLLWNSSLDNLCMHALQSLEGEYANSLMLRMSKEGTCFSLTTIKPRGDTVTFVLLCLRSLQRRWLCWEVTGSPLK